MTAFATISCAERAPGAPLLRLFQIARYRTLLRSIALAIEVSVNKEERSTCIYKCDHAKHRVMPALDRFFWFGIPRLKGLFRRENGRDVSFTATGFWLEVESHYVFVTNRHNVDPTLKFGENTSFKLAEIELEVRDGKLENPSKETRFYRITNLDICLWESADADCAIFVDPLVEEIGSPVRPLIFSEMSMADAPHLARLSVESMCTFVGFPGNAGKVWHDQAWNLPIARVATVASLPAMPYTNESVKTADVTLVSGLSFSGSSGSPVFNHERGMPPGGDIHDPGYLPPKLIGIMSGHFFGDPTHEPEMFRHSGLSYFTRATAIRALVERARRAGFKKPLVSG